MLSQSSRYLTYLAAVFYAALGVWLFLEPAQIAPVFAWNVSPFVTATIGGWCLGNAMNAFITARRWNWALVSGSLVYFWSFGILELAVTLAFRDKLVLAHPSAWLYMAALVVNVLAALLGIWDVLRTKPASQLKAATRGQAMVVLAFIAFVGFLGVYGLFASQGAVGTGGGIFPEILSPFTLRAFGAFYLSIALGAVPLALYRNFTATLHYGFAMYGFIAFITLITLMNIGLFDFAAKPGGLLYLGAYVIIGLLTLNLLRREGTGSAG